MCVCNTCYIQDSRVFIRTSFSWFAILRAVAQFGPQWICRSNCELSSRNYIRKTTVYKSECPGRNMQLCNNQKPANSNLINRKLYSANYKLGVYIFTYILQFIFIFILPYIFSLCSFLKAKNVYNKQVYNSQHTYSIRTVRQNTYCLL